MKSIFVFLSLLTVLSTQAISQEVTHPWLSISPKLTPEVYFSNLVSGQTVPSKFVVKFGMSFWGVSPAKSNPAKTGHHHLLIDKPLPADVSKPIPFDASHIHFGKGQIESVVSLSPGPHTLRLLLADHQHIPHFIFSKEITVNVAAPGSAQDKNLEQVGPDYGKTPKIGLLNFPDNKITILPARFQFHASGANVAHHSVKAAENTGHFQLVLIPATGSEQRIKFIEGQTEAWLSPPNGQYRAKLELISNADAKVVLAQSPETTLTVARSSTR